MGKTGNPRHGSMQVWPRVRAKRETARVRAWPASKDAKLLGFAGYKVGMTHILATDNKKTSITKGEDVSYPVTVIECPPMKMASVRFYKKSGYGLQVATEIFATKCDKELGRTIPIPKKTDEKKLADMKAEGYADIRVLVYTQPKLTGIGKKKPELFEVAIGGSNEEKLNYAKENLGKEIPVKDIVDEGQQLDIHAITKGKGFQGPVKRFGVKIRARKSEKTKRGPGSLGGWKGHAHTMYRIAHAGQMGYHQRTEYNKQVLKIGDKAEEINPAGGFIRYGEVRSSYLLIKGSVHGARKRLIRFNVAKKPNKKFDSQAPAIQYVSLESKQGR